MAGLLVFQAQLYREDATQANLCRVPQEILESLGRRGRVFIRGKINGTTFRNSIFPYHEGNCLEVTQEVVDQLGVQVGDLLKIELELDEEPYSITIPSALAEALATNPAAADSWDRISTSRRHEYIQSIDTAIKPETRTRRIRKIIQTLLEWAELHPSTKP